jgi:hypothetical protein
MDIPDEVQIVGMVWYQLEDFERIKAVMPDGHRLPATYSQWRMRAEQAERQVRRSGKQVVRALLKPDEFVEWCRERGLNVDAQGRQNFANWTAMQAYLALNKGTAGTA